jgi:endonuclease-8
MPEGDTIHRTAAALRTAVLGKPVTAFEAPRLTGLRPSIGAVIERVESKGKHLEIGFDDGVVLHTHMRMTGSWHLYRAGELWRKSSRQARVIIEVPGWQAVCFSAPVVRTYRAREFVPNPRTSSLGPDLCLTDVDLDACVDRIDHFASEDTTVAEVLLDQRIACGVGNVYKSEVLWVCELHPFTPVGALLPEQRRALLGTAAQLLQANLERPTRVTVPGVPGGQAVYGRHAKPCFRCSTPIEVAKHGEQARVTYWCPGCQLLLPLEEPQPEPDALAAALDDDVLDEDGVPWDPYADLDEDDGWPDGREGPVSNGRSAAHAGNGAWAVHDERGWADADGRSWSDPDERGWADAGERDGTSAAANGGHDRARDEETGAPVSTGLAAEWPDEPPPRRAPQRRRRTRAGDAEADATSGYADADANTGHDVADAPSGRDATAGHDAADGPSGRDATARHDAADGPSGYEADATSGYEANAASGHDAEATTGGDDAAPAPVDPLLARSRER